MELKPDEFWDLSWPEFLAMHLGFTIREEYKHSHTRYLAATMVNTSFNAPKKAVQPGQLYYLPEIDGDKQQGRERTTYEEMEAMRQRLSKELGRELHFVKTAEA